MLIGTSVTSESREFAGLLADMQRPVTTGRRIVVTSIRGGAGKTTVSALLATALAQMRTDRVLVFASDAGIGSLPLRLGLGSAAPRLPRFDPNATSFAGIQPCLAPTAEGLWMLPSAGPPARSKMLATAISRFFAITVADCGRGSELDLLPDAHAHLLVTPATEDGVRSAQQGLDWLAASGMSRILPRTVVMLVAHGPHADTDSTRISVPGVRVVPLPYDRHLAAGTAIDPALIAAATREGCLRAAAALVARATAAP